MEPSKFKEVIKVVLEDNGVDNAESITQEIVRSLRIIERTSRQTEPAPEEPTRKETASPGDRAIARSKEKSGVVLIEAPPVAGYKSNSDEPEEPTEYWSTDKLRSHLANILPPSIDVPVDGIGEVNLVRNISSPLVGMPFVSVTYSIPGQGEGPRLNVMTTQKNVIAKPIVEDVMEQAKCLYSKEKRVVVAKITPYQAPSMSDIMRMATPGSKFDGDSGGDAKSREEAAEWAASRGGTFQPVDSSFRR